MDRWTDACTHDKHLAMTQAHWPSAKGVKNQTYIHQSLKLTLTTSWSNKFNPSPNKPFFLCICSTSLLKKLWEEEKLLITSNFSFPTSVFHQGHNSEKIHFELYPLIAWIALWIVNTYSEFQVNIISNNRDNIKCQSFCKTPPMTKA